MLYFTVSKNTVRILRWRYVLFIDLPCFRKCSTVHTAFSVSNGIYSVRVVFCRCDI